MPGAPGALGTGRRSSDGAATGLGIGGGEAGRGEGRAAGTGGTGTTAEPPRDDGTAAGSGGGWGQRLILGTGLHLPTGIATITELPQVPTTVGAVVQAAAAAAAASAAAPGAGGGNGEVACRGLAAGMVPLPIAAPIGSAMEGG